MLSETTNLSVALAIMILAFIASWFASILLKQLGKRFLVKTQTRLDDAIISAVSGPFRLAIIVFGFELALRQIDLIPQEWRDTIGDIFFVIYLALSCIAVFRLVRGLSDWYSSEVLSKTETELDDKFLSFFRALANAIVVTIGFIILLGHFGIEPSALVTTLGIGTLAVALAAQETLAEIISRFMIMIDQPFAIGDRVEILDINTWGDVTDLGLRSTRILTRDNRMVAVPNSVIGKGLVVNYSNPTTIYRVETQIGIAYGTDADEARRVMVGAIPGEKWVMKERPLEALLLEFGDSGLLFRVRCWIEDYVETRRAKDKLNTTLYRALTAANIAIPML